VADGDGKGRWLRAGRWPIAVLVLALTLQFGNDALRLVESDAPSRSVGTTGDGRLENGKRLPSGGPGFRTYSRFGSLIGRTAVHEQVREAVLDAYAAFHAEHPETTLLYGETGWPGGGRFRPHVTHQNGLSVDFMTPVLRGDAPATLPTGLLHGFGYGTDFDADGNGIGRVDELRIDFDAIASHLYHLDRAARANGLRIRRVILAPDLQDELSATARGRQYAGRLRFSRKPSWVRHDDHYHVDFEFRD
jgi:penicillin-insensitive murein endopeptidase